MDDYPLGFALVVQEIAKWLAPGNANTKLYPSQIAALSPAERDTISIWLQIETIKLLREIARPLSQPMPSLVATEGE